MKYASVINRSIFFFSFLSISLICAMEPIDRVDQNVLDGPPSILKIMLRDPKNGKISEQLSKQSIATAPERARILLNRLQNPKFPRDKLPQRYAVLGPSGTGKTTLIKAIAQESKWPLIFVVSSLIADRYKDSGPQNMPEIHQYARSLRRPCIMAFDEINCWADTVEDKNNHDPNIAETFWSFFDDHESYPDILYLATSNSLSKTHVQIKRRLRGHIIDMPAINDVPYKLNLLKFHLGAAQHSCSESDLLAIAKQMKNYEPSTIETLVNEASSMAYDREEEVPVICFEDFKKVLIEIANSDRVANPGLSWNAKEIIKGIYKYGPATLSMLSSLLNIW